MSTKDIVQAQKAMNQKAIKENEERMKNKPTIPTDMTMSTESKIINPGLRTPNIKPISTFDTSDIMKKTDDEIVASKLDAVTSLKKSDEKAITDDRNRTIATGEQSLGLQNKLTGIKSDGSVDMANKNSLGANLQSDFDTFKKKQEDLSSQFESAQKSRVSGQLRAGLLARGIDINNISNEKLLALSDEVGAKAFGNIYNNKEETLRSITNKQDALTGRLNELREKGVIAEDKFNTLKANVESEFSKAKNNIQRSYINDIFGIKDVAEQKKDTINTTTTNTLESMLKQVSAKDAVNLRGIYQDLLNKGFKATDIYKRISNDPRFQNAVRTKIDNEQQAMGREEAIKQAKAEAEINSIATKAQADLIRASKAGSSTTQTNSDDRLATPSEIQAVVTAFQSKGYSPGNIPETLTKGQARQLIIQASNINTK